MSPPTSPRTVMVDKPSVRRKGSDDTSISTVTSDADHRQSAQDELIDLSNNTNVVYDENVRLTSHDTYKRIV